MPQRPRLLFLCQNAPYPPHGGQQLRSFHTLRILAGAFETEALFFHRKSINSSAARVQAATEALSRFAPSRIFPIPQESSTTRLLADHALSLLTRRSYVSTTYRSSAFQAALQETLLSFRPDIIHLDSLDLVRFIPDAGNRSVVVSHHNIESALLRRRAALTGGARGQYLAIQAGLMRREEAQWCPRVALNLVVSPADAKTLREIAPSAPIEIFPNGVDTNFFTPSTAPHTHDIAFVGGTTWFPNLDGMEFFADEVLPLILRERPGTTVTWVGRASPDDQARFEDRGISLTGYVEDIRPTVQTARCYIVPIRVGGGSRLKILDAWAMGKAIVSTSIGCEGIEVDNESNMLVRDSPAGFAQAVLSVIEDAKLGVKLGEAGRLTTERTYDWDVLAGSLLPLYRDLDIVAESS